MFKLLFKVTLFISILSSTIINGQEVSAPKFGKGLINIAGKDSTFTMNFSARMQYLPLQLGPKQTILSEVLSPIF